MVSEDTKEASYEMDDVYDIPMALTDQYPDTDPQYVISSISTVGSVIWKISMMTRIAVVRKFWKLYRLPG
ncbi:MAG: hypothetical protein Ct9H300mP22_7000 [Gammaproteobacteria bacterium]|nr:MAG: hypothetical protein Ct9H300mP22_7000 [Gammaproteobacteria bacterium]